MNVYEAAERACQEPTLLDALAYIALWESERVVKQAHEALLTGVPKGANGAGWDTCFKRCFELVLENYKAPVSDPIPDFEKIVECARQTTNKVTSEAFKETPISTGSLASAFQHLERREYIVRRLLCSPSFEALLFDLDFRNPWREIVIRKDRTLWGAKVIADSRMPDYAVCVVSGNDCGEFSPDGVYVVLSSYPESLKWPEETKKVPQ